MRATLRGRVGRPRPKIDPSPSISTFRAPGACSHHDDGDDRGADRSRRRTHGSGRDLAAPRPGRRHQHRSRGRVHGLHDGRAARPVPHRLAPVREPAPGRGARAAGADAHLPVLGRREATGPARLCAQEPREPADRHLAQAPPRGPRRARRPPGGRRRSRDRPARRPGPARPGTRDAEPPAATRRRPAAPRGALGTRGRRGPRRLPRDRQVDGFPRACPAARRARTT